MINYYQPFLLPFLKQEKNVFPRILDWKYFYSFEDGLWEIAKTLFPDKKSIHFLVPDFYCSDVLDNIKLHGHTYTYYRLDKNFQISDGQLATYISQFEPDIVMVFHAAGIYSQCLDKLFTNKSVLLIEDSVHRLVDPINLRGGFNNRIVMDSLRKVSPISGSRMIASKKIIEKFHNINTHYSKYFIISRIYYFVFRNILRMGFYLNNSTLTSFAHKTILKAHDDIIGDSELPHVGITKNIKDIERFDYKKIRILKYKQVKLYEKYLQNIFTKNSFYKIEIPKSDFGELHVYPLGFDGPPNESLEKFLFTKGIVVWFKFPDCPWSEKRSVLFLPLGFHMSEEKIKYTTEMIKEWTDL